MMVRVGVRHVGMLGNVGVRAEMRVPVGRMRACSVQVSAVQKRVMMPVFSQ